MSDCQTLLVVDGNSRDALPCVLVHLSILYFLLPTFFSPQSPGQYYFKPMMKEFRFEPASQMITVEEGENLSIDITGIKTAYR